MPSDAPDTHHSTSLHDAGQVRTLTRLWGSWNGSGGYRQLLRVAGPLILSTASNSIQNFVDRMFVSWYSSEAIAAAMPAGILNWTLVSLFVGIAGYVTAFVAQYHGARKPEMIGPVVWQGAYIAVIGGVVNLLLVPAARPMFTFIGHAPAVRELEIVYFRVLCYSAVFSIGGSAFSGFFAGRGKVWPVMWVNVAITVVHCGLNYILVFGKAGLPELGLKGAGIASVISQAFGCLVFLAIMLSTASERSFRSRSGWRLEPALFARLLRFGIPSGIHFFVDIAAFSVFVMIVGRIGTAELAATNIAFNINSLAFMPVIGLGTAVAVLVGQHLGEERPAIAEKAAWNGLRLGVLYMVLIALTYVGIPGVFADLFAPRGDPGSYASIRAAAVLLLRFVALYSIFDSVNIVFGSALKGAGDTRFVMAYLLVMATAGLVLPSVLLIGVLAQGLMTAWLIVTVYIIALAFGFMVRFLGGRWKGMRVIS
jgi:MATE family multidrug resistance protein